MKKIFTLSIISILALCANAQKLSFSVDGKTIENGATVISTKLHDFYHGVLGKTVFAPEVLLTCDEDAEVTVSGIAADNKIFQMCFAESCVSENTITKTGNITKGIAADLQIEAGLDAPTVPINTYKVTLKAFVTGKEDEAVSILLIMTNDPSEAGVSAVKASHSINVANGTLNYAFANAAQRTINLYAMSGQMVKSISTAKASGAVELAGLRNGIYLYRVVENGKTLCGKLIVR